MITPLSKKERVLLAGAMKSMMLADGRFEDQELKELDVLLRRLNFSDYEQCLTEFEATYKDEDSFWEEVATIKRPEAREIIVNALRELMLHEGIPELNEGHLLNRIKKIWKA